jgi:restriction endonuclease S subunit
VKHVLGDIADIRSGYPFRGRIKNDPAGDLTVLTIKDVKPGQLQDGKERLLVQSCDLNRLDRYQLQQGDVIFQSRGYQHHAATISEPIYGIAAQGLYQIRPLSGDFLGGYLAWYLNHENCQQQLLSSAQGTQTQLIPRAALAALKLAVPPLEIQTQILEVYELRQNQKQTQAKLDETTDRLIAGLCWQKISEN